jgi:DMSO/TMAO reductase YedYZ molybdopterin-dependent catalytic subunit
LRRAVHPFLFVDHTSPTVFAPGEWLDVRPQPHIVLKTVTYLVEGEIVLRDSPSIGNSLHAQTLLAYEMNYQLLHHLHGTSLLLRVENQLGPEMVDWIKAIESVEGGQSINTGKGGHEYLGELASI